MAYDRAEGAYAGGRAPLDLALLLIPTLAFGVLVTSHVALFGLLLGHKPRWRALVAFLFPPLAPYWGWVAGFRVWSSLWLLAVVLYGVGFAAASSGGFRF